MTKTPISETGVRPRAAVRNSARSLEISALADLLASTTVFGYGPPGGSSTTSGMLCRQLSRRLRDRVPRARLRGAEGRAGRVAVYAVRPGTVTA